MLDGEDALRIENARLRERVTELQTRLTELVEERRADSLHLQVRAFQYRFGQPVASSPAEIDPARMKQRLLLGAEEYCEQLRACFRLNPAIEAALMDEIRYATVKVDLPGLVGELVDSNYIAAGTAIELGVDLVPVQRLVHAANMAKEPNGLGKPIKPPGWKPADIRDELIRQGWRCRA